MSDKVLVLLSGGVDSSVVLAMFRHLDREAVGFDYDQPHKIELSKATIIAKTEDVPFSIVKLQGLTKANDVVFCGRNALMLSSAFSIAQAKGIKYVAIGTNKSDHDRFPDCRPEFLEAMCAVGGAYGVSLLHPLRDKTKSEVLQLASDLGVDVSKTWTCYNPINNKPCGECYSCKGLNDANS